MAKKFSHGLKFFLLHVNYLSFELVVLKLKSKVTNVKNVLTLMTEISKKKIALQYLLKSINNKAWNMILQSRGKKIQYTHFPGKRSIQAYITGTHGKLHDRCEVR